MKRSVPYAVIETFLSALGIDEPGFVREVRIRAPRTIEVFVYARDEDDSKHLGDVGVALEACTIHIETLSDDPELAHGMRVAEQVADLYRSSSLHAVPDDDPVVVSGTIYGDDTKLREAFADAAEQELGSGIAAEEASDK